MRITFSGGEANEHVLDLYSGAESLSGIGRVAALVTHYVSTGDVRFRAPYSDRLEFRLSSLAAGSLTAIISAASKIPDNILAAAAKLRAATLFERVLKRATGQAPGEAINLNGMIAPAGDIDVLSEAAIPALQRVHRWIDQNGKSIVIVPDQRPPVTFDGETREYLEAEELDANESIQDVSVGALNVNSRTGRVYFHDLGRTVPFVVPKSATGRTIVTLARYLTRYAERAEASVNIRFRRVKFIDGRLKRIIISDCYAIAAAA